jgi:hypothetical protein
MERLIVLACGHGAFWQLPETDEEREMMPKLRDTFCPSCGAPAAPSTEPPTQQYQEPTQDFYQRLDRWYRGQVELREDAQWLSDYDALKVPSPVHIYKDARAS